MLQASTPAGEVRKPWTYTRIEEEPAFPPSLQSSLAKERLMKWGLDTGLQFHRYKFTERFRAGTDSESFLMQFFSDKSVQGIFGTNKKPADVIYKRLSTEVLSMDFFDRLEEHGIVAGPEGYIRKCMDEDFAGLLISDKLREMLVNEDSENAEVYSSADKAELIYHVFRLLVVGGGMCQADDTMKGYLDMTKTLYKDLCTVQKSSKTGKIEVVSSIYLINKVMGEGEGTYALFPRESPYNEAIVIVDPVRKLATLVRHCFQPFW